MRRVPDSVTHSPPFVLPAKLRSEIEAALRQVMDDYRSGKVASFMVSEEDGDVCVMILKPDVVRGAGVAGEVPASAATSGSFDGDEDVFAKVLRELGREPNSGR